ncbi:hypothetical protein V8F63_01435 [Brevundimonas sp. LF-1]|uniref:hypothetical protein n=1 Tax=Brevundimonas sp. LF-1 TaxID=3126100 RepID=UPI0030E08FCE
MPNVTLWVVRAAGVGHAFATPRQSRPTTGDPRARRILSYDEATGTGLISGDDSLRYGFARTAVQGEGAMAAGVRVDFVPEGMEATQIMLLPSATAAAAFGQAAGAAPRPAPSPPPATTSRPPSSRSRAACGAGTSGSAGPSWSSSA